MIYLGIKLGLEVGLFGSWEVVFLGVLFEFVIFIFLMENCFLVLNLFGCIVVGGVDFFMNLENNLYLLWFRCCYGDF